MAARPPAACLRYFASISKDQASDLLDDEHHSSELTYSSDQYLQHNEVVLNRKREKEMEAKFGDFSARLVKRPKKNFMWGFGTQV